MGPAEQEDGGSRPRSVSSLLIRLRAMAFCVVLCVVLGLESGFGARSECGVEES